MILWPDSYGVCYVSKMQFKSEIDNRCASKEIDRRHPADLKIKRNCPNVFSNSTDSDWVELCRWTIVWVGIFEQSISIDAFLTVTVYFTLTRFSYVFNVWIIVFSVVLLIALSDRGVQTQKNAVSLAPLTLESNAICHIDVFLVALS